MPDTQQTIPSPLLGTLQPIDAMIGIVAGFIGGPDDPEARDIALRYLDRAADRLNSAAVFLWSQKQQTYLLSNADYADGDSTLLMPSDFGWATDTARALDASGNIVQVIEWLPWHRFKPMQENNPASPGTPEFISLLNEFETTLGIYPSVSAGAVSSIVIPYFARIQRPSEVSNTSILLTPEVREAMITGAEALIVRFRYASAPAVWQPFMGDFERAIQRARGAAGRQEQAIHTWATVDIGGRLFASSQSPTQVSLL